MLAGGALLVGAAFCWVSSSFGTGFEIAIVALGAGLVVVACWLFRTVASAITARRFFLRTLVVPVIFGATVLAIEVDAPVRIRFAQARPGFERAVTRIDAGADPAGFVGRIGTYRVSNVARYGRDVYFTFPGGFLGSNGLAHLPDGPPAPGPQHAEGGTTTTPFQGRWYRFSTTWD